MDGERKEEERELGQGEKMRGIEGPDNVINGSQRNQGKVSMSWQRDQRERYGILGRADRNQSTGIQLGRKPKDTIRKIIRYRRPKR